MNKPNFSRRRSRGGARPPRQGGFGRQRVANSQATDIATMPEGVVFYCKTCESLIDFHPTTFSFKLPDGMCPKALEKAAKVDGKATEVADRKPRPCEIVYGTERSIKHYYKIPDSKFDAERRADEERAAKADKL